MMSKLHLDLGLAQRDRRATALFQGRGFLEFLCRALQVPGTVPGLVELAADLVERPLQLRGNRPLGKLAE